MKITITQTVLNAMPDVAWGMFYRFMTDDEAEYTPQQKTAALCLRYYNEVYDEGHLGFFERYEDRDKDELAQALTAIGAGEFADNFIEAVKNGFHDNYEKADTWFEANEQGLIEAIQSYLKSNIDGFYEIVDEDYRVIPHKLTFWLSAIIAAVIFFFMTVIALTQTILVYPLFFLMFFAFASPFLLLMVYAKFWKILVKKDVLTICRPFRKKRTIRIDELSTARRLQGKLIVYTGGKRLVVVRNEVSEYGMFLAQLDLAGKIAKAPPTDFFIRQTKAKFAEGLMWPLSAVFFLILVVTRRNNPATIYEIVFFSALVAIALWYFLRRLPLKITVLENTLTVKSVLGHEKKCQFSDMTKVVVYERSAAIFVQNKKLVEIAFASEGYSTLVQRLMDENIPVHKKG